MNIHDLLVLANADRLRLDDIDKFAWRTDRSRAELLDAMALQLAQKYSSDILDFTFCDCAINLMIGITITQFRHFAGPFSRPSMQANITIGTIRQMPI